MRCLPLLFWLLLGLRAEGALLAFTNWNGGAVRPWPLVICMDGYTAEEQIAGAAHGQAVADGWLSDELVEGLRDRLLVVTVWGESNESGASYRGKYEKDTRYGSTFDYYGYGTSAGERILVAAKGYQAIRDANSLGFTGATVVVVANSTIYGGTGGNPVSVSRHASVAEIVRHELGHNIGGLADEYCTAYPGWVPREHPNSSTNRLSPPWIALSRTWVAGSQYDCKTWGRAYAGCKMRTLNTPWCAVCRTHYRSVLVAATLPASKRRPVGGVALRLDPGP